MITLILLTFLCLVNAALAEPLSMPEALTAGKSFADQQNTTIKGIHSGIDPHSVPNYQGQNVPEAAYYTSPDLTGEAQIQATTNDTATYITNARTNRPVYTTPRQTDPLFTHHSAIDAQATALTQTYAGCTDLPTGLGTVSLCGSQLICPDGTCTAEFGQTASTDRGGFRRAATFLAILDEMKETYDAAKVEVFRGDNKKCKVSNLGFFNCCTNSGIGIDMGTVQCRVEERELAVAQQAQQTHYVGSYRRCDFLGLNCRTYRSHCVFPSKLARIVVVQGRGQIGKPYGSASNPDCSGFTLQELPSIDFEAMDLSEFVSDVEAQAAAATTPAVADAVEDIKEKLKERHDELR